MPTRSYPLLPRMLVTAFAALVVTAAFFIYPYTQDEALDERIGPWLEPGPRVPENENGFFYLLGALTGPGADPVAEGIKISRQAAAETIPEAQQSFFIAEPEAELPVAAPPLSLPWHYLLCARGRRGCLDWVLTRQDDYSRLLHGNELLMSRYRAFLGFERYRSHLREGIEPVYRFVSVANRLQHLEIIALALAGEGEEAATRLAADIRAERAMMARSDDFLLKLTLVTAITENLQVLVHLYRRQLIEAAHIDLEDSAYAAFDAAERSYEKDMRRRFTEHAARVLQYNQSVGIADEGLFAPLYRILHKPNRTLNEIFPIYLRNQQLSLMAPSAFLAATQAPARHVSRFSSSNLVGSLLNRKAVTNYRNLVGTVNDAACFMRLVGFRLRLPAAASAADARRLAETEQMTNPYNGRPPYLGSDGRRVCYDIRLGRELCVEI